MDNPTRSDPISEETGHYEPYSSSSAQQSANASSVVGSPQSSERSEPLSACLDKMLLSSPKRYSSPPPYVAPKTPHSGEDIEDTWGNHEKFLYSAQYQTETYVINLGALLQRSRKRSGHNSEDDGESFGSSKRQDSRDVPYVAPPTPHGSERYADMEREIIAEEREAGEGLIDPGLQTSSDSNNSRWLDETVAAQFARTTYTQMQLLRDPTIMEREYLTERYRPWTPESNVPNSNPPVGRLLRDYKLLDGHFLYSLPKELSVWKIPKTGVRLDDHTVEKVLRSTMSKRERLRKFGGEFQSNGSIRVTRVPLGRAAKMQVTAGDEAYPDVVGGTPPIVRADQEGLYYVWYYGIHPLMGKEGFDRDLYSVPKAHQQKHLKEFGFRIGYRAVNQSPDLRPEPTIRFNYQRVHCLVYNNIAGTSVGIELATLWSHRILDYLDGSSQ
ncbi:hypothetical protein MMC25_001203 [Agyrium rufum]|nr:hypothetical protein [Agyrium rufum]